MKKFRFDDYMKRRNGGSSMKKFYLAYGSNLNMEQMAMRCPDAEAVGTAEIKDYGLFFKGSKTGSYLTIEPREGTSVPVGVWAVSEADEWRLDRYEGYPSFYYKKPMTVEMKNLKTGEKELVSAFVYIMHEDRPFGIPTHYYVDTCWEGYMDFGFDTDVLDDAISDSAREMVKQFA